MGIVIRQSIKASFVSYIGVGLGLINNLFVSTKFLTPEQLAITRLLLENSLVFAAFAHLGTPFMMDKFFVFFKDSEKKHNGFIGFLWLWACVGVLLFSGLYVSFREPIAEYFRFKSPQILDYHFLSIPLTAFWVFLLFFDAYSRNNHRIAIPAAIREVFIKTANIGLVMIYAFGWIKFEVLVYLIVALYGLASVLLVGYIRLLGKLFLQINWKLWKSPYTKPMFSYGLVILLGGVGENAFKFADRVMLAGQEGLRESAIFMLATFIVLTIEIPRKALSQISIPLLSEALQTQNFSKLKEIYQKVALHQFLAGLFVFMGIWACIDEIFFLLPKGDIYGEGKWVVLILGMTTLFNMASGMRGEVIMYSQKYHFTTIFVLLFAVVNILLNYYLIASYGIEGAAYATAIATVLYVLTQVLFVYKHFNIFPYQHKQIWVLGFSIVLLMLTYLFPKPDGVLTSLALIVLKASLITFLYFAFLLIFRISPEIDGVFAWLWKKIKPKK
jgi:O-antigen/teichoic acid export membrane protein